MDHLTAVLKGERRADLYKLETSISTDALTALSQEYNTRLFYLDGKTITNKAGFLDAIADAMAFPRYFGQNWDALEDCLTDLDWLNGDRFILLYEEPEAFAQGEPSEWLVALDILRSAVDYWRAKNRPLSVLFKGNSTDLVGLESI
ncbi:barstar family protein [Stenomitos frigidus]|uniref:Barnase inhibitor n=1 Tax=Stenomitos frigidus ULC18 TaxID=2107698 RepID=A0A2T1E8G2_9CYAN|nr:barstar family protein [Stenomitos frigidus]PSB29039.1 barnase inhibitor [Stenomitos frigidus ULC18]